VVRPRLFELLEVGVQGPLTLLTGPAGSGKTVLLSSWVATAALPGPVAWVSLDAADNDPARFWSYLLAALRQSGAAPPSGRLGSFGLPIGGPDRGFVLRLAGELATLEQPVVVVLDDVHEVTNPAVLDGLATVLQRSPSPLRLLLTTRDDPPLSLARLGVAGQPTEVRAAELAFTAAEAAELLADHGLVLADADLLVLQARTEGWAAGLRLAALSLQDHPDPGGFIAQFSGSSRTVADYLLEEVLGRLPEEVRAFLLHTSVVERLSGELADALTGPYRRRTDPGRAGATRASRAAGGWRHRARWRVGMGPARPHRRPAPGVVPRGRQAAGRGRPDLLALHQLPSRSTGARFRRTTPRSGSPRVPAAHRHRRHPPTGPPCCDWSGLFGGSSTTSRHRPALHDRRVTRRPASRSSRERKGGTQAAREGWLRPVVNG
jgi:hypothetical protein